MKLFESSPSLTMHNVTIVTRLRSPIVQPKKSIQKNIKDDGLTTKSINRTNLHKSNSTSKNKHLHNNNSNSQKKENLENLKKNNNLQQKGLKENISYTIFTS